MRARVSSPPLMVRLRLLYSCLWAPQAQSRLCISASLPDDIHAQIILGNTYHLYLRPGTDILHKAGGLHKFNSWDKPILTDSGGFQVFSLSANRKLKEEGAWFRSHIDGSKHLFTPENVVDIQRIIGSDIMMALGRVSSGTSDYDYAKKSLGLTLRWLKRGWDRYQSTEGLYGYNQAYFPIVQGCTYPDLRRESAKFVTDLGADGNAIGGLAVGEPAEVMYDMIEVVNEILPADRPRYLMGVGTPANILEAIDRGVDMMDCVMPTRNGRNGMLFTAHGIMNMQQQEMGRRFFSAAGRWTELCRPFLYEGIRASPVYRRRDTCHADCLDT